MKGDIGGVGLCLYVNGRVQLLQQSGAHGAQILSDQAITNRNFLEVY